MDKASEKQEENTS